MGLKDLFGRLFKETVQAGNPGVVGGEPGRTLEHLPQRGADPEPPGGNLPGGGPGECLPPDGAVRGNGGEGRPPGLDAPDPETGGTGQGLRSHALCQDPEDEQIAALVGEMVYGIPNLEEALLDLLDAIGKGFALCEIIWEVAGGQARVTELRWIPQKKVTFGEDWKPRLLTPKPAGRGRCRRPGR